MFEVTEERSNLVPMIDYLTQVVRVPDQGKDIARWPNTYPETML